MESVSYALDVNSLTFSVACGRVQQACIVMLSVAVVWGLEQT